MTKIFLIIVFILVILFLEIGISPHLVIMGIRPNLIFVSIVSLSVIRGFAKALPWSIFGGLFIDFYSPHHLIGISVLFLLLTSYLAHFLAQNLFKRGNIPSFIVIFIFCILFEEIISIISGINSDPSFRMVFYLPIRILYSTIFAIPIFWFMRKFLTYESS